MAIKSSKQVKNAAPKATVSKKDTDGLKHQSKKDAKPVVEVVAKAADPTPAPTTKQTKWKPYTEGTKVTACTVLRPATKKDAEDTLTHAEKGSVRYFFSQACLAGAAASLSVTGVCDLLKKMHPALEDSTPGMVAGHLNYAMNRPGKKPIAVEGKGVKAVLHLA